VGKSFHTHPLLPQSFSGPYCTPPGNRANNIINMDTVDWDTTGRFDPVNHLYISDACRIVEFHLNLLWCSPPASLPNVSITGLIYVYRFSTGLWVEAAGADHACVPTANTPQGCYLTRKIKLASGDMVRAHADHGFAYPFSISGSVNNGETTCCYFEGHELEDLG